jgi:hypothetical protein
VGGACTGIAGRQTRRVRRAFPRPTKANVQNSCTANTQQYSVQVSSEQAANRAAPCSAVGVMARAGVAPARGLVVGSDRDLGGVIRRREGCRMDWMDWMAGCRVVSDVSAGAR